MLAKPAFTRHLSLRNRLLLAATMWIGLLVLIAGLAIPSLVWHYMEDEAKTQLNLSLDELTANIDVDMHGQLVMNYRLSDPRFNQPYSGLYWMASTDDQMLRSRSLWDRLIERHGKRGAKGANGERLIMVEREIFLPGFRQPVSLIVGIDDDPLEKTLHALTGQLWLILALLFGGVLTLISLQVSWSLRPLGKMQKELNQLRHAEQDQLTGSYPKEIQPLVSDLNALLFHYQELLTRARHHAGNLSHALKTPISVLKNEVSQLPPQEQEKLSPSLDDLQKHIDYHLGRARMAGSLHILSASSCPSERVDALSMAFDKVYAEREILLINELDSELNVSVEKTDLDEMLGNLIENAYKWANSQIRVWQRDESDGSVSLVIEDDGPGIAKEQREQALQRGTRLDQTTPGSGLGLNIVCEMAHSYRGSLTLEDSQRSGLRAVINLPRCQSGNGS